MPVIVVGLEKNFTALRPRVFGGRVSRAASERIVESIRLANPNVDLSALTPGTVITVPDAPEVSIAGDISLDETMKELADALRTRAGGDLDALVETSTARERVAVAERKQLAAALDQREVVAAGKKDRLLGADVAAVAAAIEQDEAGAKERAAAVKKARTDWTAELDALRSLLA